MRLLLVGCGGMGSALLQGWLQTEIFFEEVAVISPHLTHAGEYSQKSVTFYREIEELTPHPWDVIVFAVKPKVLLSLLPDYRKFISKETLFVSIAAAIPLHSFQTKLGENALCARVMPNTPVVIRKGVSGLFMEAPTAQNREKLEGLFSPLGDIVWVQNDAAMDQITALSGCGPAYVFHMIEALAEAGEALGFTPAQALLLAKGTLWGASAYAHESGSSPEDLRIAVTSPGGMTEAALKVFMSEGEGLRPLIKRGVEAALSRGKEIRSHGSTS